MMKTFNVLLLIILAMPAMARQTDSLSGIVTNQASQPVAGASVYVLNTARAAVTGSDGRFAIYDIDPGKYTIRITAIGYADFSREINTGAGQNSFSLSPATRQLDAVVVSAQKKDEWLQQVPFSVSALSTRQVNSYQLWNAKRLTAIVPNLYSADPGDGRNVTSIRGITTTSYDPAVATYIDGVNQFNLDTYIPQLFDVERIEILRGPQGTLYGRNAMGGVINIITKQPTRFEFPVELSYGSYGQLRATTALRFGFQDKLSIGMGLMWESKKGFYENEFHNSKFDSTGSIAGNFFVKYRIDPRWSVMANFKIIENKNFGAFPLAPTVEEAFNNPFRLNQNAVTWMVDRTVNGSLSANYAGPRFNFSSQTSYQRNYRYYENPIDGDFSPLDAVTIINNYGNDWNTVKAWTQEFRISSPVGSRVSWTGGTYLFTQNNPVKQTTRFGEDAELIGAGDKNFSIINTSRGKSAGLAFFGQLTWPLTPKTEITAGLRYDYEHKEQSVLSEYQHDPDPNPMFPIVPDTSAEANFNAFTPKLSIAHHFNTRQQVYATYSRGYRAGGLTQISSDPSSPPLYAYKPEYSNNWEIGWKNEFFNERLRINLAAFYSTVTDAQVPTLILPDAITVTRNAGKLESKGIELEAAAVALRGLEASWAFGYTNAKYKTLKVSSGGAEVDLAGNRQVYTPEGTSMFTLQYSKYVFTFQKRTVDLVVRGEWAHIGDQYFDLANNIKQSAYDLLNTRVGLEAGGWALMFWIRNITDKKYISYAYDFGAVHLGNPRVFGGTLSLRMF